MEKKTNAGKKTTSKTTQTRKNMNNEETMQRISQLNQRRALFLFAFALFLTFLIFIEGEILWKWMHNFVLGIFGFWAISIPILMGYLAIITSFEKYSRKIAAKISLAAGIVIACSALTYFLNRIPMPEDSGLFNFIAITYTAGIESGGSGLIGAAISAPLAMLLSDTGAIIVLFIILFLSIMIFTNTTIVRLYKILSKPVKYAKKGVDHFIEKKEEERQLVKERNIDIPLDEPVKKKKKTQELVPVTVESAPKNQKPQTVTSNGKYDYGLNESIEKFTQKHSEKTQETTQTKAQIIENELRPQAPKSKVVTPVNSSQESLQSATKAAEEFIKQKEENANNELATNAQMALYQESKNKAHTYVFPPLYLLKASERLNNMLETEELKTNGNKLVETLESFSVKTKIVDICRGPTVTRYELQPAPGVRINKITNLADDLALNLAAVGVRIEAPIPGKAAVGIEIPNKNKSVVRMRELIESNAFSASKSNLTVVLGKDITGQVKVADLAKMPHTLIAGTTGSGKSVCINSLIISLMYKSSPDDVRFLMIDPKVVELGIYNGVPHLLVPVVTDPRKAAGALAWAVTEMLNRYKTFAAFNVKDLSGYNALAKQNGYKDENEQPMLKIPQIVIIIDELADLMMAAPNEVEDSICRLAQMARAAGMHLVVATQRPTVDVVTGLIKANIPSRVAFAVSSAIDSKTILDGAGAEKLLGQGDMLFSPVGTSKPTRIQGCFVTESEIESIVDFVKNSREIEYDQQIIDDIEKNAIIDSGKTSEKETNSDTFNDPMMDDAIKAVMEVGNGSTSLLQRKLRVGHARAGRLIDQMSDMGILGPYEGSKPRQLLMTYAQWLERNMQKQDEIPETTED